LKPTITQDEFLKALADQFRHAEDGAMTSRDIATKLGIPVGTAMKKINDMVAAGTLEYAGKVARPKVTGETLRVPAYRMVKKGGRK